jgi:hypothetical protein
MPVPLDNSVRLPSQDLPAILAETVTSGQNDRTPLQPDVDIRALSPRGLATLYQQQDDRTPLQPDVDIRALSPRGLATLYQQQESDLPLENETLVSQLIEQSDVRQEQLATTSIEVQPGRAASESGVSPLENETLVSQLIEQSDVRQEQIATTSIEVQPGRAESESGVSPEPVLFNEQMLSDTCSSEIAGTRDDSVGVEISVSADVGLDDQLQRHDASPPVTCPLKIPTGADVGLERITSGFICMPLSEEICSSEICATSGNSVGVEIPTSADVGLDNELQRHDASPLATSLPEGSREPPAPQRGFDEVSRQPADTTLPNFGDERASQHCQPTVDSERVPLRQSSVLGHQPTNEVELEEVRHDASLHARPQTEGLVQESIDRHSESFDGLREAAAVSQEAGPLAENDGSEPEGVRNAATTAGTALSATDTTSVEKELESLQRTVAALAEQLSNLGAEAGPVDTVGLAPTGKDPAHFHEGAPSLASSSEVSRSRSSCSVACSQVEAAGFLSDFLAERRAFEEWLNATVTAAAVMLDERDRLHRRHSTHLV